MGLFGRTALVTGGSRGLGLAIAERLAGEGANLVLTAREAEPLRRAAERVAASRVRADQQVLAYPSDVSRPRGAERLVRKTQAAFGRLDVLICNAGILGPLGPLDGVDWGDWVRTVEVNLFGAVLCCRATLPLMRRQGRGKIIAISGGGATQPQPGMSAYAASKAALVRFVETLAHETRTSGIDVNAVAPGALNTRFLDELLAAGPERVGHAAYERARRQQAEGGASIEAAAALVTFLASSDSDGITGRLVSAVWDDWRDLPAQRDRLAASDVYTLRRIVPADRGWPAPTAAREAPDHAESL